MSWFTKKTYPDFYQKYLDAIAVKHNTLEDTRFVVFDTETTGLNTKEDKILSIGCIGIQDFKISIADQFECYLTQEKFNKKTVKIHGLLKDGKLKKVDEYEAIKNFLKYIGNAILVAHHAAFDVAMINSILQKHNLPKLKNKIVDTSILYKKTRYVKETKPYSLDDLCNLFQIKMHDRHTASGDAYLTALVFLKTTKLLAKKKGKLKLKYFTSSFF